MRRIELRTFRMRSEHSTTELHPLFHRVTSIDIVVSKGFDLVDTHDENMKQFGTARIIQEPRLVLITRTFSSVGECTWCIITLDRDGKSEGHATTPAETISEIFSANQFFCLHTPSLHMSSPSTQTELVKNACLVQEYSESLSRSSITATTNIFHKHSFLSTGLTVSHNRCQIIVWSPLQPVRHERRKRIKHYTITSPRMYDGKIGIHQERRQ